MGSESRGLQIKWLASCVRNLRTATSNYTHNKHKVRIVKQWQRKKLDLTAVIKKTKLVLNRLGLCHGMQWNVIITTKQTLSIHYRTSFSWSLGDQLLKHFKKSLLTLKETIPKRKQRQRLQILKWEQRRQTTAVDRSQSSSSKPSSFVPKYPGFRGSKNLHPWTNLDPPSPPPPNQGWGNGAFLPFTRLHSWFGGDGGFLFHFILDKINRKPRPPLPPKSRMGKGRIFALRAASSLI